MTRIEELKTIFEKKKAFEEDLGRQENRDFVYTIEDWSMVDELGDELITLLSKGEYHE